MLMQKFKWQLLQVGCSTVGMSKLYNLFSKLTKSYDVCISPNHSCETTMAALQLDHQLRRHLTARPSPPHIVTLETQASSCGADH